MPEDAKFCTQCGQPAKETDSCPKCGTKLSPSDKFCPGCGTRISEEKFHTHKKANIISKSKKKIILLSLGCVLLIALLGAGVFFGYKTLKGSDTQSNDGWVEIGHVSFANEYGVTDPSDPDPMIFFADEIGPEPYTDDLSEFLDYQKKKEKCIAKIRINYFDAKNLSDHQNVILYKKTVGGTTVYEISTSNGRWQVERGAFVTRAGEIYNARVLYLGDKPEVRGYCYFNIDD